VLQCVAVRLNALQCVAVRYSALQCVAVRCSVLQRSATTTWPSTCVYTGEETGVLQCTTVRHRVSQGVAVSQCVAVCRSALQYIVSRCSVLQPSYVLAVQVFTPWTRRLGSFLRRPTRGSRTPTLQGKNWGERKNGGQEGENKNQVA